ncbi:malto-oligosyltrehalose synthase [bacterium]|nr:malto-oligosyltrehalose synthase [bacterium]
MHLPVSTYRIQFHPDFAFEDAQKIVPYLAELGVSDLYASPIFKARSGSSHGYDVVDMAKINPELGGEEGFEELSRELRAHEMAWLQDVVPNHMAFAKENLILMDVLENGPNSRFYQFFDIEWNHPYESIRGRVLAPFLGGFYGDCLEKGEIQLKYDRWGFSVNYYDLRFPLRLTSYLDILTYNQARLKRTLGSRDADYLKFLGVTFFIKNLPAAGDEEHDEERGDQIAFVKHLLWELYNDNNEIRRFIDENVATFNGRPGDPESFHFLDETLNKQHYRLAFWKVGTEELNFRRFFSINDLISLRMEDTEVFERTHRLIFDLVRRQRIHGLRIDHIDGLYDPTTYLERLRDKTGATYLVVEKILELKEELPPQWPIQGTTGYEFLNMVNGLFCDSQNVTKLDRIYKRFADVKIPYQDLIQEKKRLIIGKHMAGDVDNLAHLLKRISSRYRDGNDLTLYALRRALVEFLTQFPHYRTYISPDNFTQQDATVLEGVFNVCRAEAPVLVHEFEFLEKFVLAGYHGTINPEERADWIHFIMRVQQFTGPLMAKGIEDTVFYIFNRLVSLNEVGANLTKFGFSPEEFHAFNINRMQRWTNSMSTTSTHDTKRGEDVRARINVLSEIPEEWDAQLKRWRRSNQKHKPKKKSRLIPSPNDEYFLYQTLLGVLPPGAEPDEDFVERVRDYAIKSVREAKEHTAWLRPDDDYEQAYSSFIQKILEPRKNNSFLKSFMPFARKVQFYGALNSLSQTLLKIASPGVPDFYQGSELWDLNLVDPDNRRPVDFEVRQAMLKDIVRKSATKCGKFARELMDSYADGRVKMFVTHRALKARSENAELFQRGRYMPCRLSGEQRNRLVVFTRELEGVTMLVIAPRFFTQIVDEGQAPVGEAVWQNTMIALPDGAPKRWRDAMTSADIKVEGKLPVGQALENFPVALLIGESI